MEVWRVLDTGLLTGAENITLDRVILDARAEGVIHNTFRFLRFNPPVALVGYHQSVEQEIRISYCLENNIDINRRITGGGAIYFSPEHLGWEVFATLDGVRFPYKVELLYRRLCNAAVKGLRKLGLKARFRPKNDIEIGHRKISGTGGTSTGGAFMFQGTLLVDLDVDKMLRALKVPVKKLSDKEVESLKERVTTIKWELGYTPSYEEIKKAILEGFSEEFQIKFVEGEITDFERTEFLSKLPYFSSNEWVYGIRPSGNQDNSLFTVRKTPGGLVKLALSVDVELNLITSAFITGDFFAYPPGIIYDLESSLKHIPLKLEEVSKALLNMRRREFQIPGVKINDFKLLFKEAIQRIKYTRYGLTLNEVNNLFFVNKDLDYFMVNGVDSLLLPYCSKLVGCDYRHREGCTLCGLCTVGDGYKLASKYNLKPFTIVNYEHLEEKLKELDETGSKGYIGCCCEPFYEKHQPDFEKFRTPGLLINIEQTTCYDLGLEKEAYKGRFESQTALNTSLLEKMLYLIFKHR
ncbi:MAG: DUF116 domain-containing protein [Candidatus Odinarchaeum yellowstonii]|uniref:lipoate--protein ligase n=1 Tax=Odinarchaeota yellowstonii (strain LCB_4) TaxID=1841599 RepID=A0AAF0IBA0_ODILC|nr:MAG: DUF116 domain-containing protein [Candidatus Odinarchaeum yellowstonii]